MENNISLDPKPLRTIRIWDKSTQQWTDAKFDDARKGMIIQIVEPTGEICKDLEGEEIFEAISDCRMPEQFGGQTPAILTMPWKGSLPQAEKN